MTDSTANISIDSKSNSLQLEINGLKKSFGNNEVLKNIQLKLFKGENLIVLGKSGTGKSVLIKCIVGLIKADYGSIKVFNKELSSLNRKDLNEIRKKIGFLFQSAALYDSMSVYENLVFPLKRIYRNLPDAELLVRAEKVLTDVGLLEAIYKMPSELSGGMRKRIGLARTLIINPEIMLYDEPTTGLDPVTSREISQLINKAKVEYKTSSIIITHDMDCAELTGDRIVMIKEGEIYIEGTYSELNQSNDSFVKSFFISKN